MEATKEGLTKAAIKVNEGLALLWLLTRHTFYVAAALLFISFYGATAETTVYSLAATVHTATFWMSAVIATIIFNAFVYFARRMQ
jgi:steroid 5-alpha reductase family enzyme